jgi:hypothetical protein
MYDRLRADEEYKKMDDEWLNLVEPDSVKRCIWRDMNRKI